MQVNAAHVREIVALALKPEDGVCLEDQHLIRAVLLDAGPLKRDFRGALTDAEAIVEAASSPAIVGGVGCVSSHSNIGRTGVRVDNIESGIGLHMVSIEELCQIDSTRPACWDGKPVEGRQRASISPVWLST